MADNTIARIAVAGVPFQLDRLYDYTVPAGLAEGMAPGVRVTVPFGRANRPTEGVVLALAADSSFGKKLKPVSAVLDAEPLLTAEADKACRMDARALFLHGTRGRARHAARGLWFREDGKRRVGDKYVELARLAVPAEEAMEAAGNGGAKRPIRRNCCARSAPWGRPPWRSCANSPARPGSPSRRWWTPDS